MNDHDVLVGHEKIQHFGNVTTEEITQIIQPWGLPPVDHCPFSPWFVIITSLNVFANMQPATRKQCSRRELLSFTSVLCREVKPCNHT